MLRLVNTTDATPHRPATQRGSRPRPAAASHASTPADRQQPAQTPQPASDPRWILAVRTACELDGGRAAVLTPARRDQLNKLAAGLRISTFDAALIIATVQDAARRGEPVPSHDLARRVTSLRPGVGFKPERSFMPWILAAICSAATVGLTGAVVHWITSV